MKCFYRIIYNEIFSSGQKPLDSFVLKKDNKAQYEISALHSLTSNTNDTNDIANIFAIQENRDKLFFVYQLGYRLGTLTRKQSWENKVSKIDLFNGENNEEINSFISHLLAVGNSKLTSNRKAVDLFKKDVLEAGDKDSGFKRYMQNYYTGKYSIDYRSDTIFLIGIDTIISVFQALTATKERGKVWLQTIDFLFEYFSIKKLSKDLICALYFVDISKDKVLFYVIEKFNQLSIEENYVKYEYYEKFLRDYLHQLYVLNMLSEPANICPKNSSDDKCMQSFLEDLWFSHFFCGMSK